MSVIWRLKKSTLIRIYWSLQVVIRRLWMFWLDWIDDQTLMKRNDARENTVYAPQEIHVSLDQNLFIRAHLEHFEQFKNRVKIAILPLGKTNRIWKTFSSHRKGSFEEPYDRQNRITEAAESIGMFTWVGAPWINLYSSDQYIIPKIGMILVSFRIKTKIF